MGVGPWGAEGSLEEADLPSCNAPVGHLSLIFIPLLRYLLPFSFYVSTRTSQIKSFDCVCFCFCFR